VSNLYRCGNQDRPGRDDCGCGERCERVPGLSPEEFEAVTAAFVVRLNDAMAHAGCNDLFPSEFPESVCGRFDSDRGVLAAWKIALGGFEEGR